MGFWKKAAGVFGRVGRGLLNVAARAGAPIGAAIGSIVPGVGTATGAALGTAIQGLANRFI